MAAVLIVGGIIYSGLPGRALFALRHSYFHATTRGGFVVRNLLVQGRVNLDPGVLRGLLGVSPGDSLMAFDPAEAAAALGRLSWVKEVRVERRLPDTVYVKITERQPLALWQNRGKLRLIDDDGVVLTDAGLQKFSSLPLIVGEDAPTHAAGIFAALTRAPPLAGRIEALMWVAERRWDVRLKNGMTLQLPADGVDDALRRLASDDGRKALADKDVTVIDLREPDRLSVRTRTDAAVKKPAKN